MLTAEEQKELETIRKHLARDVIDDEKDTTKEFWWQPACVARAIELERKDAAEAVRVSSCDWCGGWTTSALAIKRGEYEVCHACFKDPSPQLRAVLDAQKPAPDFDDEPTKERKR